MHPHGSDRLRVGDDGRIFLSCRIPKPDWNPRVAKTLTSAEFPGTAILWDDAYYEVIAVEALPQGVRYELAPWRDEHAIRLSDRYDEESEAQRAIRHRQSIRREEKRKFVILTGMFAGHLPSTVQEELASELGVSAPRLTIVSVIPPVVLFGVVAYLTAGARMAMKPSPVPLWLYLIVAYMTLDSTIRFGIAWLQSRPLGSLPGLILYAIYHFLSPKKETRVDPFAVPKGFAVPITAPPEDVAMRDSLTNRAAFATLLSEGEQRRLAERHGYDYRQDAKTVAIIILVFALLGTFSSAANLPDFGALITMLTAAFLAIEQIYRLTQLPSRPVGSVLGVVARPLLRKFLR